MEKYINPLNQIDYGKVKGNPDTIVGIDPVRIYDLLWG
jgi:hypothetical protein